MVYYVDPLRDKADNQMNKVENTLTKTKRDLAVFRVVVKAGLIPTDSVLEGLWHWFPNVDIALPLPVMSLKDSDRKKIASNILDEMYEVATRMENELNIVPRTEEDYAHYFENSPDVILIDNLWRELTGVYAFLFNAYVNSLSREDQIQASERLLESMESNFNMNRAEAIAQIHSDPRLRMQLRMIGVNPDSIK